MKPASRGYLAVSCARTLSMQAADADGMMPGSEDIHAAWYMRLEALPKIINRLQCMVFGIRTSWAQMFRLSAPIVRTASRQTRDMSFMSGAVALHLSSLVQNETIRA